MATNLDKRVNILIKQQVVGADVLKKEAKKIKQMGGIVRELSAKQQEQAKVTKHTQRYAEQYGMAVNDVSNGLKKYNLHIGANGNILDMNNKKVDNSRKAMARAAGSTKKFQMEFLSLMFGAQAVTKALNGLIQPVMQLTGITEVWRATLISVLQPVLFPLAQALMWVMFHLMRMPKWLKYVAGGFIVLFFILAKIVGAFAQWMLLILGVNMLLLKKGFIVGFLNKQMKNNSKENIKNAVTSGVAAKSSIVHATSLGLLTSMLMGATGASGGLAAGLGAVTIAGLPLWLTIMLIVAALIALIAITVLVVRNWDTISSNMKSWGKNIVDVFKAVGGFFKKWFSDKPEEWTIAFGLWLIDKWNWLKDKTSSIFSAIGGFFKLWFWTKPIEWVGIAVGWIVDKWNTLKEKVLPILESIGSFFKKWFYTKPKEWIGDITGWITGKWETVKTKIEGILSSIGGFFKKWFWTKPEEWIDDLITKIKSIELPAWMQTIIDAGKNVVNYVKEKFGGVLDEKKDGGYIPQTGPYLLHQGETVIPANNSFSPNITIHANVSSDIDIKNLANQLSSYWSADFSKLTQSRGGI